MNNYRYENKYIVDSYTYELLSRQLKMLMKMDSHSINDNYSYEIRSLYYDDLDNSAYHEKVDGIEFRKKYRLRMYNNDTKTIKLECKFKDANMTKKLDSKLSERNAKYLVKQEYDKIKLKDEFYLDFLRQVKTKNLKPKVIVDYKRLALTYPASDVRITFDYNLKSSNSVLSYFEANINRTDCFEENEIVLEVKYNEFLPDVIQGILNQYNLRSVAISKFATCVDYL